MSGILFYLAVTTCAAVADVCYNIKLPAGLWWTGGALATFVMFFLNS